MCLKPFAFYHTFFKSQVFLLCIILLHNLANNNNQIILFHSYFSALSYSLLRLQMSSTFFNYFSSLFHSFFKLFFNFSISIFSLAYSPLHFRASNSPLLTLSLSAKT